MPATTSTSVVMVTSTTVQSHSVGTSTSLSTSSTVVTSQTMVPVNTVVTTGTTMTLGTSTSTVPMSGGNGGYGSSTSSSSIMAPWSNSSSSSVVSTSLAAVSTTSSSVAASQTGSQLACPSADGQIYNGFQVECGSDRTGGDSDFATKSTNSLVDCINLCAQTSGCVDVSYVPGTPGACYLKNAIVPIQSNSNVWGARSVNATSVSSSSSATTPANYGAPSNYGNQTPTSSSSSVASSSSAPLITCPQSDGQTVSTASFVSHRSKAHQSTVQCSFRRCLPS